MTLSSSARIVAAVGILALTWFTLSPLGLRPHVASASTEYLLAYLGLGLLLAIGFPRGRWLPFALALAVPLGLELAQLFTPDRHARFGDFALKVLGGEMGVAAGLLALAGVAAVRARTR